MIKDKDISIVVQGPILYKSQYNITDETTKIVCQRLRKIFKESEIILSTWERENVSGIPFDKVIFNKDPGATWFNINDKKQLNNCNRLIVSTFAGIKAASNKYVLKVRSDLFLISKKFLTYFDKFSLYEEEFKFVQSRIIAFSLNSLYGHKTSQFTMNRPFHISDWAYFGYKSDLLNLYDIPLTEEPDFSQWFLKHCKNFMDFEPEKIWRMPPEQYITYSFLKKFVPIHLKHTADTSNNNMEMSSKLLTNNFLVLDQTQFSLISLKYLYFPFSSWQGFELYIAYSSWLAEYYRHNQIEPLKQRIKFKTIIIFRGFFYKISHRLLRKIDGTNNRICQLIARLIKVKIATKGLKNDK